MSAKARNSNSLSSTDDSPLANIRELKQHDFARTHSPTENSPHGSSKVGDSPHDDTSRDDGYDTDSTATESESDNFDWDGEDEVLSAKDVEAEVNVKRGRRIWHGFMKLSRPLRTLIVATIGAGILITPLIVFQVHFRSTPGRTQAYVWSLWLTITWAASCGTYLLVDMAPKLALWVLRLFSHSMERWQITVELTKAILGWLKLALDVSWAWIALSVIRAIYQPSGQYWVTINRVMQALFSAAVLLLAEKIFLQYVAINFHRRALADRIAENQLGLRALDRLSNATPNRTPLNRGHKHGHRSQSRSGSGAMNSIVPSASTSPTRRDQTEHINLEKIAHKAQRRNDSDESRRRGRIRVKKAAIVVGDAFTNMALKHTRHDREVGAIYSASKLARKLFSTLQGDDALLTVEDFYPYFNSVSDAESSFAVFDKDGNGDISKREMRDAVRRIYKERRAITASLKDMGSVIAKLDAVLLATVLVVLIFICLLIFNRNNTIASLVPLATIVLGFSFIFGHSAQTLFESLIFIFSTHVFDVGDLVMIDDSPMFVVEFGLFATTFKRVDGQTVIAPNALLASAKTVHNLRRSSSMWETTTLMVSFDTPLDSLERLRKKLEEYISTEQNRREWANVSLHIDKMEYQNAIHLVVGMEHRPNWQDWGGRWGRRTKFMRHLKNCLEELDVKYTMPLQPVLIPDFPSAMGGGDLLSPRPRSPPSLSPHSLRPRPSFLSHRGSTKGR